MAGDGALGRPSPFGAPGGRAPNQSPDYLIDLFFRSPRISVD
jgi:hypothetical protein